MPEWTNPRHQVATILPQRELPVKHQPLLMRLNENLSASHYCVAQLSSACRSLRNSHRVNCYSYRDALAIVD